MTQIGEQLVRFKPIFVTMDEAARHARAVRSSRFLHTSYLPETDEFVSEFSGTTDTTTYFYLFTEAHETIEFSLEMVAQFANGLTVTSTIS
jgi:hypothetical protein